jgi:hypothetical protein
MKARYQDAFQKCGLHSDSRKRVAKPGSQVADCDVQVPKDGKKTTKKPPGVTALRAKDKIFIFMDFGGSREEVYSLLNL